MMPQDLRSFYILDTSSQPPPPPSASFKLRPRPDKKSGQDVILWSDILKVFKNAQFALCEDEVVPFLVDDNFEDLVPLRIASCPGKIIDVLLESPRLTVATSTPGNNSNSAQDSAPLSPDSASVASPSSSVSGTTFSDSMRDEEAPSLSARAMKSSSFLESRSPQDLSAILGTATTPSSDSASSTPLIMLNLGDNVDNNSESASNSGSGDDIYYSSANKSPAQSTQLNQMELWSSPIQSSTKPSRIKTTTETISLPTAANILTAAEVPSLTPLPRAPQAVVDPLNLNHATKDTQDSLRAHVLRNRALEYHEALLPRLFIVLPTACVHKDKISPAWDSFRLFWMCECSGWNDGDEWLQHLDYHQGYALDRPAKFFDTYGPHLLLNLQMFKFSGSGGIKRGGSHGSAGGGPRHGYYQGLDLLQRELDMPREQVEYHLDLMISHLQQLTSGFEAAEHAKASIEGDMSPWDVERGAKKLPHLDSDELSRLPSFIIRPSPTKTGFEECHNLYRHFGKNGNIQWVCLIHFCELHPQFDPKLVRTHTEGYGLYTAQYGFISARPRSSKMASQLFSTEIMKAGCLSDVSIQLAWDVTSKDIRALQEACVKFKLVSLSLSGDGLRIATAAHSESLLGILSSDSIRRFVLDNAHEVLKHMAPLLITRRPMALRILNLRLDIKEGALSTVMTGLLRIILNCPKLQALQIIWDELDKVSFADMFLKNIVLGPFRALSIRIVTQSQEIVFTLDRGIIQDASFKAADILSASYHPLVSSGGVHTLSFQLSNIPFATSSQLVTQILSVNPNLYSLTLYCCAIDFQACEEMIKRSVQDVQIQCNLRHFYLKDHTANDISAKFTLSSWENTGARQNLQTGNTAIESLSVDVTIRNHDAALESFIFYYGPAITSFYITHPYCLHFLMILDESLKNLLLSKLTRLLVELGSRSTPWVECLQSIVNKPGTALEQLVLIGQPMHYPNIKNMLLRMLKYFRGKKLCLLMHGWSKTRAEHNEAAFESGRGSIISSGADQWDVTEQAMLQWVRQVRAVLPNAAELTISGEIDDLPSIVPGITMATTDSSRYLLWSQNP
ncbi:hypothetical protein BGX28_002537 [Mortierella sp. GBA30]|nr:hypothetical protein BGX28_002537 [Mortierella sp. GBA30]